jgi:protein-S-isoprenylcysteine O-methyltransferase Ste14
MNSLAMSGLIRTIVFLAVVALLIFVPADSVRFWPGWLFLLVTAASISVITYYLLRYDPALLERRMRAGPRAESRPSQRVIQAAVSVFMIAILILAGLDHRFGFSRVPAAMVISANAAIAASFILVLEVLRENSFASATIRVESDQRLITSGLYSYVRHPMYAGALIGIIAMPLALGCAWAMILVVPVIGGLVARILDEERLLASDLPGYAAYYRGVKWRLLPMVW